MDNLYIGVQGSYKTFSIALFENNILLQSVDGGQVQASSQFLPVLQHLLQGQQKSLHDLQFIAVDQGPGAFTSLRVIIATLNGIAISGMPLIGVDGLDALAYETYDALFQAKSARKEKLTAGGFNPLLVSLLNAYNNEVYYGVYSVDSTGLRVAGKKGYKKIDLFLESLSTDYSDSTCIFTGNGATLHHDKIVQIFGDRMYSNKLAAIHATASAQMIGKIGYAHWTKSPSGFSDVDVTIGAPLRPLYLKTQTFAIKR